MSMGVQAGEARLTRGQMAAVNQVSKKALLVYEEKGLLVPEKVDENTGYRYYSYEQCSTLDIIQRLQETGASLAQIKEVLDRHDLDYTISFLENRIEELSRREREIAIAKESARGLLSSCHLLQDKPECGEMRLKWIARRRVLFFPERPYVFQARQVGDNKRLRYWEKTLRAIKADFVARGLPIALFHNVGCVVSRQSLETGRFMCVGGYIYDDGECGAAAADVVRHWDEGFNLMVTIDHSFFPDGTHVEYYWLERMLETARANGFSIRDDYHCDILAESPVLFYTGREMMLHMYLPVDIHGKTGPFLDPDGVPILRCDPSGAPSS